MDSQKVTIIMVSENNYGDLLRSLDSIVCNDRLPNRIIIGDNDSKDGTYDKLCKYLGAIPSNGVWPAKFDTIHKKVPLTIFRVKKQNKPIIINACIRMSFQETTIYGFLDGSSWYRKNAVQSAIDIFINHQHASCVVSNSIKHFPNGITELTIKKSYDANRLYQDYEYDENMFVSSSAIYKLRMGFENSLEHMFDYDMMLKLSRIGLIYHSADFLYETDSITPTGRQLLTRTDWINRVRKNALKQAKANG